MTCVKCKKTAIPDVEYAGNHYCNSHFLELMEKRVRKNLRVNQLIDVNKEYVLFDDLTSEAKVTEYFLNKIFKGYLKLKIVKSPLKIVNEKNNKNDKTKKSAIKGKELIIPTNLDEQVLLFLDNFLKNKKATKKDNKNKSNEIFPLEVLMQKEIELICRILKIKFYPRVKKDILDELEKRYPGTKFSLFQSKMNLAKKNVII
jgi:hypothetical protein